MKRRMMKKKTGKKRRAPLRRKRCKFCMEKNEVIDYKDGALMQRHITDRGKIVPRRISGNCARHQRRIAEEVKKARFIALLPFVKN